MSTHIDEEEKPPPRKAPRAASHRLTDQPGIPSKGRGVGRVPIYSVEDLRNRYRIDRTEIDHVDALRWRLTRSGCDTFLMSEFHRWIEAPDAEAAAKLPTPYNMIHALAAAWGVAIVLCPAASAPVDVTDDEEEEEEDDSDSPA